MLWRRASAHTPSDMASGGYNKRAEVVYYFLRRLGYDFKYTENGHEAETENAAELMKAICTAEGKPNAIIIDIHY